MGVFAYVVFSRFVVDEDQEAHDGDDDPRLPGDGRTAEEVIDS